MKSRMARVLLASFLALIIAGAWYKPLDNLATTQIDAGLKRALISFALARTFSGIISIVESADIAATPLGVGAKISPGRFFHPLNELLAEFAEFMLAASIAFAAMKVLISIGSFWGISLLMSAFAVIWGWYRWRRQQAPLWVERVLFAFLFIRFAMPIVTVGSDAVFEKFMQDEYTKSQNAIEGSREELMTLMPTIDESNTGKGVVEQVRAWWSNIHIAEWFKKVWQTVTHAPDHLIRIIVVFLLQTLVIPLLLFWALYRGTKFIVFSPSHLLHQLDRLPDGVTGRTRSASSHSEAKTAAQGA